MKIQMILRILTFGAPCALRSFSSAQLCSCPQRIPALTIYRQSTRTRYWLQPLRMMEVSVTVQPTSRYKNIRNGLDHELLCIPASSVTAGAKSRYGYIRDGSVHEPLQIPTSEPLRIRSSHCSGFSPHEPLRIPYP